MTATSTMAIFLLCLFLIYVPAILYLKFDWFKRLFHDILRWHKPGDGPQWFDGCSQHAVCKHCGKEIMQDSQGNWF